MTALVRTGSGHDVAPCIELWVRVIAARDGAQVITEVTQKASATFEEPHVRFARVGSPPQAFALTVAHDDHVAHLTRICVDPAAESHGLGTALLADAIEHARAAGYARITLDVRETNARAIMLYARAGFVRVTEPWDYDGGVPLTTWSLTLDAAQH